MTTANSTTYHDEQVFVYLALEQVVSFNQHALAHMLNGNEMVSVRFLEEALALLALIARHEKQEPTAHVVPGGDHDPNSVPYGLALVTFARGDEAPCSVLSVIDDGSFTFHHGLEGAQRILTTLVLYHAALAIHRGCCRVDGFNRRELTRSHDLYEVCAATFADAPELNSVKFIMDEGFGKLCAMFDCPAAA
jgi:hypothetical protein